MILRDIKDVLEAELLVGDDSMDMDVNIACASDLLTDVLAFTKPRSLLLTGLTHPQVVRTTEVAEIAAVCFVRGKRPPHETVELARERHVPLLRTSLPMYESCGRLYSHGLKGCSQVEGD